MKGEDESLLEILGWESLVICGNCLGKTYHSCGSMDWCPKGCASFNIKAINVIFNAISLKEFKKISNVKVAHTEWNILQTVHEGIKPMKINKLQ